MRRLKTTLGFYSPSFMRMEVDTQLSLRDFSLIKDVQTESVYLHEFVHYIQDITTAYGLANINVIADYMRFVNNHLVARPAGPFNVPVEPIPFGEDKVDINHRMQNIYLGSGEDSGIEITGHKLIGRPFTLPVGEKLVESIEVTYITKKGKKNKFEFGALCIIESMAYLIEKECYPSCPPSPDLPYNAAEKLVQFIYPTLATNRLNILALCDCALKAFHPGPFFYGILLKIRNNKKSFSSPEEIYSYCFNNHEDFEFYSHHDLVSVLIHSRDTAIEQLGKYFNDLYFAEVKNWLQNMIGNGVNFRLRNQYFVLDLARGGSIATNTALKKIINEVGTPLVTNGNMETTLFVPGGVLSGINYPIIWALDQIHKVFWGMQKHCEMATLCRSSGINTDKRCANSPWDRANDLPPHCSFAMLWRHWKLAGYHPVIAQKLDK